MHIPSSVKCTGTTTIPESKQAKSNKNLHKPKLEQKLDAITNNLKTKIIKFLCLCVLYVCMCAHAHLCVGVYAGCLCARACVCARVCICVCQKSCYHLCKLRFCTNN